MKQTFHYKIMSVHFEDEVAIGSQFLHMALNFRGSCQIDSESNTVRN